MKYFYFLIAIFVLIGTDLHAQTTNVEFRVNMNYKIALGDFDPATQTVDIAGSFNAWGAPTNVLSDSDSDGIYTTSVALTINTTIQFKTRIDGQWDGTEEFSGGGPNRIYNVIANGVVAYWYNDELPPDLLNVNIQSSAAVIQPGQTVQFSDLSAGNPVAWNWDFPGGSPSSSSDQNPQISYPTAGVYSVTLTITNDSSESLTQIFTNFIRVDPLQTFWWNDRVFYEIFVRSFKDSNGDGKGDIQGLISKLDYLNDGNPATTTDLGITGLWLMPIQQSPSYHGYDVTNYTAVESDYGSNADFQAMIAAAHARGIKVIIDMVMNHSSSQHPWFVSSQNPASDKRDWYVWSDTNPGTAGWHPYNGDYFYGAFYEGMPDLNFYNQEVRDEFENISTFWLSDMGADGFRLDAANLLMENATMTRNTPETIAYWHEFRDFYKSVNPDAFAVGEVWESTSIIQNYVNNQGLDYCFEFDLSFITINALNTGNAVTLRSKLSEISLSYPFLQYGTFLTNHDMDRVMSQFTNDVSKAKAAASLLMTMPGIPYIYYGEEIGMTGVSPDPQRRTPMQWAGTTGAGFTTGTPWQAINADYTLKNVFAQQANSTSLWSHYRNLIAIRNNESALRKGNYRSVNVSSTSVMAFIRQFQGENVLVITNVGNSDLTDVSLSFPYGGITPGDYTMSELVGSTTLNVTIGSDGGFSELMIDALPAKTTLIYKLQEVLNIAEFENFTTAVYPVPSNDYIYVAMSGAPAKVEYSIIDTTGRQLLTSSYDWVKGENHKVSIEQFPSGLYFIKFNVEGKTSISRFIVE